jgi:hypothetical protein
LSQIFGIGTELLNSDVKEADLLRTDAVVVVVVLDVVVVLASLVVVIDAVVLVASGRVSPPVDGGITADETGE